MPPVKESIEDRMATALLAAVKQVVGPLQARLKAPMTGTLRRLKDHYGFIEPDGGAPGESVFFHRDGLRLGVSFGDLRSGMRVDFDLGSTSALNAGSRAT